MQGNDSDEAIHRLKASAWSSGATAFHSEGGGLVSLVSGSSGENLIRAEGIDRAKAWRRAVEQSGAAGTLR